MLFEVSFVFAQFDLILDESLYFVEPIHCTPGCIPLPHNCTPCDYSMKERCGITSNIESNSTCECEEEDIEEWCEEEDHIFNTWETIKDGQQMGPYTIDDDTPFFYGRFFFDKPCHGIHIRIIHHYGMSIASLDTNMDVQDSVFSSDFPFLTLCPREFLYKYGTYSLKMSRKMNQSTKFSILLSFVDFGSDEKVQIDEPKRCEEDPYQSYCLGQNTIGPIPLEPYQFEFFRMSVLDCVVVLVHSEVINSDFKQLVEEYILFQLDEPSTSLDSFGISGPHSEVLTICPSTPGKESFVYFTLFRSEISQNVLITVSTNSSLWEHKKKSFSEFGVEDLSVILMGSFDIKCGEMLWTCRSFAWQNGVGCLEAWTIIPIDDQIGLWPRPMILANEFPDNFLNLPYTSQEKVINNTLSGGFVMEMSDSIIKYSTGLSETQFKKECQFILPNIFRFITQSNNRVSGVYNLTNNEREEYCNFEEFSEISQKIDSLIKKLSILENPYEILAYRYIVDSQPFSPIWQDCEHYIKKFLEFETQISHIQNTNDCPSGIIGEIESDPCCSEEVAWNQCCTKRDIEFNENVMKIGKNSIKKQKNQCPSQKCLDSFLGDYIFNYELRDSQMGCKSIVSETISQKQFKVLEFFRQCKLQIFGEDGYGIDCERDDQCPFQCDLFEHKCVFNNEQLIQANDLFFECVNKNITSDAKNYIEQKNKKTNDSNSEQDFVLLLKENYQFEECVSSIGRSLESSGYLTESTSISISNVSCPPCDFYCFDSSCVPPLRCEENKFYGKPETLCPFNNVLIPSDHDRCYSKEVCNWNPNIETQEDCSSSSSSSSSNSLSSFGCFLCETPSSCRLIEEIESKEECETLKNGCIVGEKILIGLSEEECSKENFCSQSCDENCHTKELCEQNGRCSDQEFLDIINETQNLPIPYVFDGMEQKNEGLPKDQLIIRTMNPWNKPDCASELEQFSEIPTHLGCLITSNYTWQYYIDNDKPLIIIPLSKNKEECERLNTCFEEEIVTDLTTPKSKEECELCGGSFERVFEWTQAKWIEGRSRKLEWIEKKMVPKNRMGMTINFRLLAIDISSSVTEDYSLEMQTQIECRLNGLKNTMNTILCLCLEDNEEINKERNCSQNLEEEMLSGVGKVCSGQNTTLVVPPSILEFNINSFKYEECVSISVILELSSNFKTLPKKSISSSFRKEKKYGDRVKNEKGSFVGDFVGNGVLLRFEGNSHFNDFRMCLNFDDSKYKLEKDQEFDFAYLDSEEEIVTPLGISNIEVKDGLLCAFVNDDDHISSSLFPIIRKKDWENSSTEEFTDQQSVIYSLMLVLYLIPSLILFLNEAKNFGVGYWQESKLFQLFLILALIVRSLYFIIMLVQQNSGAETVEEFLTLIFPTFAYLSAVSVAAMLWAIVTTQKLKRAKSSNSPFISRIICVFVNICLYSLFIIVAVYYQVFESDTQTTCLGRVTSEDSSDLETLRIVYLTLLAFFTILIVFSMIYFSGNVAVTFSLFKNKGNLANNRIRQWMLVTFLTSLSVLSQCLFQICYTLFASPSELYALILVPTELIPVNIVIFISIVYNDSSSSSVSKNDRDMGTVVPGSVND